MEQEAIAHGTANGVEKSAPVPATEPVRGDSVALSALLDKREKMLQGLNSVKAQREAVEQRLKDLDISVNRTEGAVYTLETLITEIDPEVLQRMAGG